MGRASSAKKIQRVQRAGVGKRPGQRRNLGFPLLVIAIIVLGCLGVYFARTSRVEAADVAPQANRDHWHAAFGIYNCDNYLSTTGFGENFPDNDGIHSHGDGLIHIHPFVAAASGKLATFGKFAEWGEITIDGNQAVTLPAGAGGTELRAGKTCSKDGQPVDSELKLFVWPPQANENTEPEVITDNFDAVRFAEDGQVFVLALVPKGTEKIPLPPSLPALENPLASEGGTPTAATSTTAVEVPPPDAGTAPSLPVTEPTTPASTPAG